MNERVSLSFEDYYGRLDLWTKVNVIPKNDGGIAAFFSDITAQKKTLHFLESEKLKLEAFFLDSSAAMALLRGDNFTFEKINPKYADLFRGRSLINKTLVEALPELRNTTLPQIMSEVYNTGTSFIGKELLIPLAREAGDPLVDSYFDFTFSRIDDSSGKSLGIGLYISKQIVEAHKGQILLEIIPAKGSTFTVILPRLNKYF